VNATAQGVVLDADGVTGFLFGDAVAVEITITTRA